MKEVKKMSPLINTWSYTRTIIDWPEIEKATGNQFQVVSVRPYVDKKGKLPEGYVLTCMVLKDDHDYGIDKQGNQRESNLYQNFDVTVLNRKHPVKKGDAVRLLGFDEEHSFAIGFDLILRFKDYEVIKAQGSKPNA